MTMIDVREVAAVIEQLRSTVQGDGADLELVDVEAGVVRLRLRLDDVDCAECVLPASILEEITLDLLRRSVDGVNAVHVTDPRMAP